MTAIEEEKATMMTMEGEGDGSALENFGSLTAYKAKSSGF
jgi:hypothetical protein